MNGGPGGAAGGGVGGGVACCADAGLIAAAKRNPRIINARSAVVLIRTSSLFVRRIPSNSVSGNLAHKLVLQFAESCKRRAWGQHLRGIQVADAAMPALWRRLVEPAPLTRIAPQGRFMLKMNQYLQVGCGAPGCTP